MSVVAQAVREPTLTHVYLWNYGEPTLHPRLLDIVELIATHGVRTILSTNGLRLAEERFAGSVFASGLSTLILSVDGFSARTYEAYRVGASFDTLLTALRICRRLAPKSEVEYALQFIAMRHNTGDLRDIWTFAADYGFDTVDIKTVGNLCPSSYEGYFRDLSGFMPDEPWLRRKTLDHAERAVARESGCPALADRLVVAVDGRVYPCCWDSGFEFPLGSLLEATLTEILAGPAADALRSRVAAGQDLPTMCRVCPARCANAQYLLKQSDGDSIGRVPFETVIRDASTPAPMSALL